MLWLVDQQFIKKHSCIWKKEIFLRVYRNGFELDSSIDSAKKKIEKYKIISISIARNLRFICKYCCLFEMKMNAENWMNWEMQRIFFSNIQQMNNNSSSSLLIQHSADTEQSNVVVVVFTIWVCDRFDILNSWRIRTFIEHILCIEPICWSKENS